jgi:hypothetical protein
MQNPITEPKMSGGSLNHTAKRLDKRESRIIEAG